MKVTVKQYLEETHEVSCIVDSINELSGSVIIVDPFNWHAVENTGHDFRLVGRSMVDKVYDMSDYDLEDDVYYPKVFEEISVKTQPCPICGTHLITPKDFFPALHKLSEELEAHGELVIKDYEIQKALDGGSKEEFQIFNSIKVDESIYGKRYRVHNPDKKILVGKAIILDGKRFIVHQLENAWNADESFIFGKFIK